MGLQGNNKNLIDVWVDSIVACSLLIDTQSDLIHIMTYISFKRSELQLPEWAGHQQATEDCT